MDTKGSSSENQSLDYLFHPKSIAIAGVSDDLSKPNAGRLYTESLMNAGYKGRIYLVSPSGGEIFGSRIYPSVKDIPDTVDYVISAIPASYTPQLILDCATKGTRTVQMFTAGFSELGDEKGKQLEWQITAIARQKGIRVIGPNCMGLYCPKTGLSFSRDFPKESGPVGYIAQSGGNSVYGVQEGVTRGIYFSKVISYGNASDLNESDFLEYLTYDPQTKIIAAYIEGVKKGRHFMEVLRQAAKRKPAIIFKSEATESGRRAAASHTSSMTGSSQIWSALLKQANAIQVHSVEELFDMIVLFRYMSPPRGKNTAIIGAGGGASVQAADVCSSAGLNVPPLPAEIRQKLQDIGLDEAGNILGNPMDIFPWTEPDIFQKAIKIVADHEQTDLLLIHIPFDIYAERKTMEAKSRIAPIIGLSQELNKRTVVVLHSITLAESNQIACEAQTALSKAGFPVYTSLSRAANALVKFIRYHQRS